MTMPPYELLLITALALIVFVAKRLPDLPERREPTERDFLILFRAIVIILLVIFVLSLL